MILVTVLKKDIVKTVRRELPLRALCIILLENDCNFIWPLCQWTVNIEHGSYFSQLGLLLLNYYQKRGPRFPLPPGNKRCYERNKDKVKVQCNQSGNNTGRRYKVLEDPPPIFTVDLLFTNYISGCKAKSILTPIMLSHKEHTLPVIYMGVCLNIRFSIENRFSLEQNVRLSCRIWMRFPCYQDYSTSEIRWVHITVILSHRAIIILSSNFLQ